MSSITPEQVGQMVKELDAIDANDAFSHGTARKAARMLEELGKERDDAVYHSERLRDQKRRALDALGVLKMLGGSIESKEPAHEQQ